MIVYALLAVTLLLAALSLRTVARPHWPARMSGLALGTFVWLYGAWVYLSVYAKWVFGVGVLILLLYSFRRGGPSRPRRIAGNLLLAVVTGALSVLYFTGTTGQPATAELAFPLKGQRYIVLQGGLGLPANFFHATGRGAVYALDISRLNRWGNRANCIFSQNLEDYAIFGDTIYAPCSGRITRAVSDNPDNIPPDRRRGPHNLNGVVIEGDRYTVFLGHMKQNAVFVDSCSFVRTGAPLGLVGNSGFSIEPHLHLQVHDRGAPGSPWYANPPLYPVFGGKRYLLFETIPAPF